MKKLIVWLAVFLFTAWSSAIAAPPGTPSPWKYKSSTVLQPASSAVQAADIGYLLLTEYTVATLPTLASGDAGAIAVINDGDGATDCTTGSGSDRVVCRWTGSAWANAGDGTAEGSAEVQDEVFSAANFNADTTHGVSQDDFYDLWHGVDADDDGSFADETWLTAYMTEAEFTTTIGAAYDTAAELEALFSAKQDAATAATDTELANLQADDLVTLSGVAIGSTHLGEFTGTTITDSQTIKSALQELEAAVEAAGAADAFTLKVDAAATAGYLGAANNDGILRTDGTILTYTDGGDYVTLGVHAYLADLAGITANQGDIIYFNGTDWVDLGPGTSGQYLQTQGAGANPQWASTAISGDIENVGDVDSGAAFTADGAGNTLYFEGTTANAYEVILTAADPTDADYTVTLPAATGTVVLTTTMDGENIIDDTIDDDSIDWSDVTAADITMTDAGVITASGLVTASAGLTVATGQHITVGTTQWDVTGADTIDGEQIANDTIDDDSIDFSDVTLADLTFDVGSVSTTEFGYLNNVTSSIQTQLDARCLESAFGETLQSDDFVVTSTVLNLVAEIPHVDATTSWSADQTFTDGTAVILGTAGEFANVEWDTDVSDNDGDFGTSLTGEGLVFTLNGSAADSKVIFNNSDATYGVDLYVKDIYYSGAITSTDSSAGSYIAFTNNSSGLAPSGYRLYFETDSVDVLSYSVNGSEKRVMNLGDAQTVAGVKTFSARQVLQGDADVGDASNAGSLRLYDGSDHYIDLQTEALSASRTWALPNSYGSANQAFLSDGDGTFSWGNPSADPAGSDTQVQFNNSGSTGADAGFTFNATTDALTLGEDGQDGSLVLYNESGATDYNVTIQPGTQTAAATITLPGSSATLATLGANTFSGHQTLANNYDLLAATPGGSDLGGGSNEFGDIYLHDSAVIYGQADGSATLTSSASTWTASNLATAGTLGVTGVATFTANPRIYDGNSNHATIDAPDISGDITITLPSTTSTLATLAANTFSGHQTLANTYNLLPGTAGGSDLGSGSAEFGDLYLHDSAVIYGQADGSATLTSSASTWTASNLASAGTLAAAGDLTIATADPDIILDDTDGADGFIQVAANDADDAVVTLGVDDSGGNDQGYVELDGVNETVDILQNMTAAGTITSVGAILPSVTNTPALGSATYAWADVFIGDGGVINFNEDMTITHSLDTLTIAGGGLVAPTVTAGSFISSADDGAKFLNITNGVAISTAATTSGLLAEYNDNIYMSDGTDWDKYLLDSEYGWTASGAVTFSGGLTVADAQTITFAESAADPDDAAIQLSAADGVFKIAAANGANNEDLTIDLDAAANTATIGTSTSVATLSTALAITSTGAITGGTVTDGTVTLAGDGTITGVSVGGLPDNIVDNGMMADNAIDSAEIASGAVDATHISDWYAYDVIPIAWAKDGSSAPDALDDGSTRSPYQYRTFASDSTEDVNFVWFVPSDLSGSTIQYRVKYLVTNATGPSNEGVAFALAGISAGDNDATNGTKGTAVVVTDTAITAAQHDILITDWSGDVTVTALAAGEIAEMNFARDHDDAADDYGQVVGVLAVEIRYVQNVAK